MTNVTAAGTPAPVVSLIPARMDRLPWTRFHWSVVVGLGVSWILDGLEIELVASAGFQHTLHMTAQEVGLTGTVYLAGQVTGALVFGRLSDRLGRRKFFIITLAIYLIGSGVAGLSFAVWFLWIFRFVAGLASAANTPPSTPPSMRSSPRATAAGWISRSTAPTGPVPRSAPPATCSS